jgi:hypothetical protein
MGKRKEVSFQRMTEILSKHCGASLTSGAEILPPKDISIVPKAEPRHSGEIRWSAVLLKDGSKSQTTIKGDGYSILRCQANGEFTGRFLAFAPDRRVLGGFDDAAAAKHACNLHRGAAHAG